MIHPLWPSMAAVLLLATSAAAASAPSAWPMVDGSSTRNAVWTDLEPEGEWDVRLKRSYSTFESHLIAVGPHVLAAADDQLMALDLRGGDIEWRQKPGALAGSMAVADDTIYLATIGGRVSAHRLADGSQEWSWDGSSPIRSGPVVDPERVYAATGDGLVAIQDGRTVWMQESVGDLWSAPIVGGSVVVGASFEGNVTVLDAMTGKIVWQTDLRDAVGGVGLARADGLIFVASASSVWALWERNGTVRWSSPLAEKPGADLAVAGGLVLVPTGTGLIALDADSGGRRWVAAEGWPLVTPVVVDDRVYAGSFTGTLHVIDLQTGSTLYVRPLATWLTAPPLIFENSLIVLLGHMLPWGRQLVLAAGPLEGSHMVPPPPLAAWGLAVIAAACILQASGGDRGRRGTR